MAKKKNWVIYVGLPVSGSTQEKVRKRIVYWQTRLEEIGFLVQHPFLGEDFLRPQQKVQIKDNLPPALTDGAIFARDMAMIDSSQFVVMDLLGAKEIHIGCIIEIARAFFNLNNKQIVVVMEDNARNPNDHAFIRQMAGIRFPTREAALNYLKMFT